MQTNYFKLFCALAFLACAAGSCWATVESLHLLLPSIPIIFVWVFTVAFFFIASWGSKLIVDSLNSSVYTEHPGLQLLGGTVLLIIFWLICSMPTNTHTFYYKDTIKAVATPDLEKTSSYLRMLETDEYSIRKMNQDWEAYKSEVLAIYNDLCNEAKDPSKPGFGERCDNILLKLDNKLGQDIYRVKPSSNTIAGWNQVLKIYKENIERILTQKRSHFEQNYKGIGDASVKNKIRVQRQNVNRVLDAIHNMNTINDKVMIDAGTVLTEGYSIIEQYADHVGFAPGDRARYTNKAMPPTARMLSVWDVWMDFFQSKLPSTGKFVFWIVWAVLIDVAGFVFFDLAFKKER